MGGHRPRRRSPGRPVLSRFVSVAVAVPRLELDRPFTYRLPDGVEAITGHLVSVPFHGRTVRGWVLGPTDEVPDRVLPVRRVLSRRAAFDQPTLALCRWVSERYVVPLAVAIDRAHPPRVAAEEERPAGPAPATPTPPRIGGVLSSYPGGPALLDAARAGSGAFVVRPLPEHESGVCVEAVAATLAGGRDAVVVVPEGEPLPATARAVAEAFGEACLVFVGGEPRERYRAWLDALAGRYRVVVGTRPTVFAPVRRAGLVWVSREAHPGHREERTPSYHVREVALARARLAGAACVLAGHAPSADAADLADAGRVSLVRPGREVERLAAPVVETARPEAEDRSPRLTALLRQAGGAFLLVSRRGYGVARICRSCGQPARCAECGGPIVRSGGAATCAVCDAPGRCAECGGTTFGVERGGTERIAEWAARVSALPVSRVDEGAGAVPPGPGRLVVGTAAAVKDFGSVRTSLVAVLDADRARRRAGLGAPEQVLATWFEAAAWAGSRTRGGRVLVHTREPGDPAVQALVRWDPWHFHRAERRRRVEAGFPPNHPVFRVRGTADLAPSLAALEPITLLSSSAGAETVCLITLRPNDLPPFRERMLELAQRGTVTRVEAEPHL